MKIYTRTGDDGTTGLFGGPRVSKDDKRIEAYGTVDELNAALGLARNSAGPAELLRQLEVIQHQLFSLGAELASPNPREMGTQMLRESDVDILERWIDQWESQLPPLRNFILPAGTNLSVQLHLARAICRRAERRLVTLMQATEMTSIPIRYLNRVGDLLFVQSRVANHLAGVGDVPWVKETVGN